jgi:methylmalonyl-CoA mutase N-terminal domain/subunit
VLRVSRCANRGSAALYERCLQIWHSKPRGNIFEVLMDAVRVCSLGQITHALFEVGGQYRRSM